MWAGGTGKKILVVCLAGAQSLLRPEKKILVVCLAGARSLLRPEKKVLVGKKSSSHLSGALIRKSPRKAWAGSSSPREASVFVSLSVSPSVRPSVRKG